MEAMERKLLEAKRQYFELQSANLQDNELKRYRIDEDDESAPPNRKDYINFAIDGKVGCVPRTEIVYLSDIIDATNNKPADGKYGGNYQFDRLGEREFLHPPGVTWRATNKFGEYEYSKICMDKLFNKE